MLRAGVVDRDMPAAERLQRTEQLIERYHALVFRYAYRLCGRREAAEDISQEVFLRVFRAVEQLRNASAERAWLCTITRNEFSKWCRKQGAQRSLEQQLALQPSEIDDDLVDVEAEDWVQAALEQLPSEFRTITLMFYFEHLSYTEIAEQLQIPLGTVMSRLNRGKGHLKRWLEKLAAVTDR